MAVDMHEEPGAGTDSFEESEEYTYRMQILQNEQLTTVLRSIEANLSDINNYAERQRNKEAPTVIDLGPLSGKNGAGSAAGAVWQSTQKFRVTQIILGGGVIGDNFRLKIGSLPYNFFGDGSMVAIPMEIEIDRGIDINVADITTPANVAWTFMIMGYPE